jgi:hypothetical protein
MNKKHPYQSLLRIRSPKKVDMIFDMVCSYNYFAGQFQNPIPVDESRLVFEHIKKLLSK